MKKLKNSKTVAQPQPVQKKTDFRIVFFCAIIIVATVIAFLPSLQNDFVDWDDSDYVTQNADLHAPFSLQTVHKLVTSVYSSNYHPLTMLVYYAEYQLFKLDPVPYHTVNLVVHCVNAALVCILLWLLSGSCMAGFLGALLFAIHPLRVESVAWIAELKDVASLITWLYFLRNRVRMLYAATLILFILAMLSKPMAISLPVALVLLDYLKHRPLRKNVWLEKMPFAVVAAIGACATIIAQHSTGAMLSYAGLPFVYKLCVPFYALIFYLVKTIVPMHLSVFYAYPPHPHGIMVLQMLLSPFVVAGSIAALFALRAWNRYIAAAVLFYIVALLPVLQVVPVGTAMVSERYTYLPLLGFAGLAGWGAFRLLTYAGKRSSATKIVVIVVVTGMACTFGCFTYNRCSVWRNTLTMWNDVILYHPDNAEALLNRGTYYLSVMNDYDNAIKDISAAIALHLNMVDAYSNRGSALMNKGRFDLAIEDYTHALAIAPQNQLLYINRAMSYLHMGRYNECFADFVRAQAINPNYPELYLFRGNAYVAQARLKEAVADYSRVLELSPELLQARQCRAACYYDMGLIDNAARDVDTMIQTNVPVDPAFVKTVRQALLKRKS
jgi:Flp pilus assembly protein TadD